LTRNFSGRLPRAAFFFAAKVVAGRERALQRTSGHDLAARDGARRIRKKGEAGPESPTSYLGLSAAPIAASCSMNSGAIVPPGWTGVSHVTTPPTAAICLLQPTTCSAENRAGPWPQRRPRKVRT